MTGLDQDPAKLMQMFKDPAWGANRLKDLSIFSRFSQQELTKIYSIGSLVKFRPKANVVIEGEPSRGMYLVLSGRLSVYKNDPTSGAMARLAVLEDGANFGEMSLFDLSTRSATVVAESLCVLFQLDGDRFDRFLKEAPVDLALRFYKTCAEELAGRFRRLNGDYINAQQLLWKYALRKS